LTECALKRTNRILQGASASVYACKNRSRMSRKILRFKAFFV
jgi:hypothetical protein